MDDSTEQGQTYAKQMLAKKKKNGDPMVDFPVYYPTRLAPGSIIDRDTRAFLIDGPDKDVYTATRWSSRCPATPSATASSSEYYGVSGTDWVDAPILDNPSETRTIDGRDYLLFYDGDRLRLVGWKTNKAAYWVNNTLLQSLDEGQMLSIATSMREFEDEVASRAREREREAADRRHRGRAGSAWSPPPASPRSATRWSRWTSTPAKIEALRSAAPLPIHEPGLPELVERNRERLTFTTEMREVLDAAPAALLLRRHAADLLRRRRPLAGRGRGRRAPRGRRARAGDEEHRAGRHRRGDPPLEARPRLRLLPRVPQGGLGGRGLPPPRPGRDRRRPRLRVGRRRGRRRLRAARRRDRPHRRRLGGDDQARLERLPGDEDLVHQRDRQRLRGGRRRRHRGRARAWASTTASARSSCRPGIGYGGSCFPKDVVALKKLAGNTGYHFQLLNSVIEVNELQKRRVITKLTKHLGSLVGKRVALLGLAFKPNTDDMREASSLVLSARLQGEGATVVAYDPVAEGRGRELLPERRARRLGRRGARRRRRRDPGHRVARVRRARLGGAGADGWRTR